METCPNCKSTRIGHFRMDSDWAHGGDWYAQNPKDGSGYTQDDMDSFANNERPDIECCVCCQCLTCFEPMSANVELSGDPLAGRPTQTQG